MSRYAIGVGCRRGCAAEIIVRLVRDVTGSLALPHPFTPRVGGTWPERSDEGQTLGLFTMDVKRDELGLHEAAAQLGLSLTFLSPAALDARAADVLTRSSRVALAVGIPSVAEAAALAGAGPGSRLLGPRQAQDGATCAVAIGEDWS